MRSTEKINDIVARPGIIELKLDAESLGKLIRAKALQAAAMHFAVIGLGETLKNKKSPSVQNPTVQDSTMQKPTPGEPS